MRQKAQQGYARGDETRARVIAAAVSLFGEKGFHGASTREVANLAEVTPPAVQYYFGGKEGLYLACLDYIHSSVREKVEPALIIAENLAAQDCGRERLVSAYCDILDSLADVLIASPDARDRILLLARRHLEGGWPDSGDILRSPFDKHLHDALVSLVAKITGRSASDDMTILQSVTIAGQLLFVQIARDSVLRATGWNGLSKKRISLLKTIVRRQAEAILLAD